MHRTVSVAAAVLALAACSVERTPEKYLDPRDPAVVERRESEEELATRVGAFREALARGNRADALAALNPTTDAHVMGVQFNDGRPRFGPQGIADALATLRLPRGAVARTPDLRVQAATREGGLGWFATHLELLPVVGAGGEAQWLRASGVFLRREGEWRLLELHLSKAEAPAPVPARADSPRRADTAAAAATARDSSPPAPRQNPAGAAAPPAGG
ncbi:MAG TPA: nuclear transport factor 2 family protein [Longimicrobium sp.]|nr:nuclear transport factor 2 family protein [Longimicrobium sp.]